MENNIKIVRGGTELLDYVKPLWEKLNEHHRINSTNFKKKFSNNSFECRKKKFFSDNIMYLLVDMIFDEDRNEYVGYCISSVNKELIGEIDSLFIDGEYRGIGIGDVLMKRAINWLDGNDVTSKIIGVAEGNELVLDFYKRFGFFKRTMILEQIKE